MKKTNRNNIQRGEETKNLARKNKEKKREAKQNLKSLIS
jgi:hypothetical protein